MILFFEKRYLLEMPFFVCNFVGGLILRETRGPMPSKFQNNFYENAVYHQFGSNRSGYELNSENDDGKFTYLRKKVSR